MRAEETTRGGGVAATRRPQGGHKAATRRSQGGCVARSAESPEAGLARDRRAAAKCRRCAQPPCNRHATQFTSMLRLGRSRTPASRSGFRCGTTTVGAPTSVRYVTVERCGWSSRPCVSEAARSESQWKPMKWAGGPVSERLPASARSTAPPPAFGVRTCTHHSAPERSREYSTPAVWWSKTARASRSSPKRGLASMGSQKVASLTSARPFSLRQSARILAAALRLRKLLSDVLSYWRLRTPARRPERSSSRSSISPSSLSSSAGVRRPIVRRALRVRGVFPTGDLGKLGSVTARVSTLHVCLLHRLKFGLARLSS